MNINEIMKPVLKSIDNLIDSGELEQFMNDAYDAVKKENPGGKVFVRIRADDEGDDIFSFTLTTPDNLNAIPLGKVQHRYWSFYPLMLQLEGFIHKSKIFYDPFTGIQNMDVIFVPYGKNIETEHGYVDQGEYMDTAFKRNDGWRDSV